MRGREVEESGGRAERKTAGNQVPTEVRVWDTEEEGKENDPAPHVRTLPGSRCSLE